MMILSFNMIQPIVFVIVLISRWKKQWPPCETVRRHSCVSCIDGIFSYESKSKPSNNRPSMMFPPFSYGTYGFLPWIWIRKRRGNGGVSMETGQYTYLLNTSFLFNSKYNFHYFLGIRVWKQKAGNACCPPSFSKLKWISQSQCAWECKQQLLRQPRSAA